MKIQRIIFLSTIAAMLCVSLQAADKIAPAKSAWAGPQIETKVKAAVAATVVAKKADHIRALEVMYGAEFDEKEQRLKSVVREGVKFDEATKTLQKTIYTPQALSKPLVKIISDYVPEFHYFTPARKFAVSGLVPASGTCASFINKVGKRIYVVPCKEGFGGAYFMLCDEEGKKIKCSAQDIGRLAKVVIMPDELLVPDAQMDEKTKQEKRYKMVTSSHSSGAIQLWNEEGDNVKTLPLGSADHPIDDFDIVPQVSINGEKGALLVGTFKETNRIRVCHLLPTGSATYSLVGWGNFERNKHIRLIPSKNGCTIVTCEALLKDFEKNTSLCWYDAALRRKVKRNTNIFENELTSMECISYDEDHSLLLLGDSGGVVQGYRIPYAWDLDTFHLEENRVFKISLGKKIIALKAYKDSADGDCPHVVVKTDNDILYDLNINTQHKEAIISRAENECYMGLGTDTKGRTTILTCADEAVCEWEKNTDPFNSLYEKYIEEPQSTPTLAPISAPTAVPAENPVSCSCIVM